MVEKGLVLLEICSLYQLGLVGDGTAKLGILFVEYVPVGRGRTAEEWVLCFEKCSRSSFPVPIPDALNVLKACK